jgi:hypothetical protein
MKTTLLIITCLLFLSCESEKNRASRISNDVYVYLTPSANAAAIHLDIRCKRLSESDSYRPILKRSLTMTGEDIYLRSSPLIMFCPTCSKPEDIDKLKSKLGRVR